MALGPTLVGGIFGAAVAVGIHVALAMGLLGDPIETTWFPVVIGLFTGLGVRQATKAKAPGASYGRGAVSALIALAATVLTYPAISAALTMRADDSAKQAPAGVESAEADGADAEETDAAAAEGDAATDQEPADAAEPAPKAAAGESAKNMVAAVTDDINWIDFLFMAAGALLAYEFGRGNGDPARHHPKPSAAPVAMDPSN